MNELTKRRLVQFYKNQNSEFTIDDITFNDLNLDALFDMINHTSSSLGEEVLYSMLRHPLLNIDEISKREELINRYSLDSSLRTKNKNALKGLSKLRKYSVFEYLYHLENVPKIGTFAKFLSLILMIVAIAVIFFNVTAGLVFLVITFIYNTLRYFKLKDGINPYLISVSYVLKAISYAKKLDGYDKEAYEKIKYIKNYSVFLGTISGATVHGGSGNPLDLILDFLKMGFHFDIIIFYLIIDKIILNKSYIENYLISVGNLDAYISIGEFRDEYKGMWCIPNFIESQNDYIKITDCRHPLLKECVGNDVLFNKSVLLTGSNASGKSTFLRSIALNTILAQSLNTVFAKEYEAPIYLVISSMSISDNLLNGESFYMAEVKSLKRIIDLVSNKKEYKVMTFVDEVLRGTNTKERIASSTKILEFLSNNALSFAATHDIELTSLLEKDYINYHFSEDVINDDIVFNYKLKEGPANSHNAIKLLSLMGFPKEIVDDANNMIEKSLF